MVYPTTCSYSLGKNKHVFLLLGDWGNAVERCTNSSEPLKSIEMKKVAHTCKG